MTTDLAAPLQRFREVLGFKQSSQMTAHWHRPTRSQGTHTAGCSACPAQDLNPNTPVDFQVINE
jgi:hypothetical protein